MLALLRSRRQGAASGPHFKGQECLYWQIRGRNASIQEEVWTFCQLLLAAYICLNFWLARKLASYEHPWVAAYPRLQSVCSNAVYYYGLHDILRGIGNSAFYGICRGLCLCFLYLGHEWLHTNLIQSKSSPVTLSWGC